MLHVLVGNNASGKTKLLYEKASQLQKAEIVSNLNGYKTDGRKFNPARVYIFSMACSREVTVGNGLVLIDGAPPSVCNVISDFLRIGDYLIYDEPDSYSTWEWSSFMYESLYSIAHTYRECWITTHRQAACLYKDADYYNCDVQKYVSEEEAIDILT